MMRDESWLRKQVSWQAFKEGKSLANNGRIQTKQERGDLITGTFRKGKGAIRCVVKIEGQSLSAECNCRRNRTTGEVCEHAVALLLSKSTVDDDLQETPENTGPAEVSDYTAHAYEISLPDRYPELLSQGRLVARLKRTSAEPNQADLKLCLWLAKVGIKEPSMVNLNPDTLPDFLDAISENPQIHTDSGSPVLIPDDPCSAIPLIDSRCENDSVILTAAKTEAGVFPWGQDAGIAFKEGDTSVIGRLPVSAPNLQWLVHLDQLTKSGTLKLPLKEFLSQLDAWLDAFTSNLPGWLGSLRFESAKPIIRLSVEGSLNALDAKLSYRYGDGDFHTTPTAAAEDAGLPTIQTHDHLLVRSPKEETALIARLENSGWGSHGSEFRFRDHDAILSWIADELPEIKEIYEVDLGTRIQEILKKVHIVSPEISTGSAGSLEFELSFQTNHGRRLEPEKLRQLIGSGKQSTKTRDGQIVILRKEISDTVNPLLADLGIVPDGKKRSVSIAQKILFENLRKNKLNSSEVNYLHNRNIPDLSSGFTANLRDYQDTGNTWMTDRLMSLEGVLLGDEMGLGKTVQTIAAIGRIKRLNKTINCLLLLPASLIGNWQAEIQKFDPSLSIVTLMGAKRDSLRESSEEADITITSYGTFGRDRAYHLSREYDLVVCDEASLLRNPDSETSRQVAQLNTKWRIALTGTPIENSVSDLWSIFRFVAPGYLGKQKHFLEKYGEQGSSQQKRLSLLMSPYYLRRTKDQVATDLPEKIEIDDWLDLDPETRDLYSDTAHAGLQKIEDLESKDSARIQLFAILTRLRQVTLGLEFGHEEGPKLKSRSAKVSRLMDLLEERHLESRKTLVFSSFAGFLRNLRNLKDLPADHVFLLDGSVKNRAELVEKFQQSEGSAVFLISLKAGGYGLNLTAADTVIHMDPWWNPAAEAQASDRAHRIGQTRPVTIYRLLAKDTIEERVRRIQSEKQQVIDALHVGGENSMPSGWNEQDIRSLLA